MTNRTDAIFGAVTVGTGDNASAAAGRTLPVGDPLLLMLTLDAPNAVTERTFYLTAAMTMRTGFVGRGLPRTQTLRTRYPAIMTSWMITGDLNNIGGTDTFIDHPFAHTFWTNDLIMLVAVTDGDPAAVTGRTFFFEPS